MKTTKLFFIICIGFALVSCKPEENYIRYTYFESIDTWSLPDTIKVYTQFDIAVHSKIVNSCIKDFKFYFEKYNDTIYQVYSKASFENRGESCVDVLYDEDSTFHVTLTKTGTYYFYFLKSDGFVKDSIEIVSETR